MWRKEVALKRTLTQIELSLVIPKRPKEGEDGVLEEKDEKGEGT